MLFFGLYSLRRIHAGWLQVLGCGAEPTPSWVATERPGMRLLAYQDGASAVPAILLAPAPIKRAYIFDLIERASVVRRWREAGRAVFLLEWTDPVGPSSRFGLAALAHLLLFVSW